MDVTQWILGVGGTVLFLVWAIAVPHAALTAKERLAEQRNGDEPEKAQSASASAPTAVAHAQVPAEPKEMKPVPAVLRKDPLWQPVAPQPTFRSVPRELMDFPRKTGARRAPALAKAQWLGPLRALQQEYRQTRSVEVEKVLTAPADLPAPLVTTNGLQGPVSLPSQHDGFDPLPPWEEEVAAFAANSRDGRNPFAPI